MKCEPNDNFDISPLVRRFEKMIKSGKRFYHEESEFLKLMEYYAEAHDYMFALKVSGEAMIQYPFNIDFRLRHIESLVRYKDFDQAFEEVEKAAAIAPNDFEVHWMKAKILICKKSIEEALAIIEILKSGADNEALSRIYYLEGLANEAEEDFEEMFECLKYSLLCDPHNENSLRKIWVCAEMINSFQESIELHKHIINEDPYSYMAWYNLGQAYSCEGEYEKALTAYEYAYLIEPGFELGYQDRGDLLFELGRYEEALECYNEWYEIIGPDPELMTLIGHCYLKIGLYNKAAWIFRSARRLDPYNDEIYYLIGECHFQKGEFISAINYYQKALERESLKEEYYAAMASAFCQVGEYTKSHYYYQKAEEIGPDQAYIWKKHGLFLFSIGEHQEALAVLEEGIENTMDADLMYCKAGLLVKINRMSEGMAALEEALLHRYENHQVFHEIVEGIDLDENILSMLKFFAPQSS